MKSNDADDKERRFLGDGLEYIAQIKEEEEEEEIEEDIEDEEPVDEEV